MQKELTASDVIARLAQAGAKLLVTDESFLAVAEQASQSQQVGSIPLFILDGPHSQLDLLSTGSPQYHGFQLKTSDEAESNTAFLNRTSGSTGNMKSVVTTHAHFIAALEATRQTIPSNTTPDSDVWLSSLSLGFFINAKLHMGLNVLLGIPVVLMNGPFDGRTLDIIERHRITFLFLTPPIAASIAKNESQLKAPDLSSVKWLLSAGAPMHEGLQRTISAKINDVHLDLEWASSETLLIAIQMDGKASIPGSSGVLVNSMEAKVIDTTTGEELDANESGELLVRNSACRFAGYKANDAANKAAFDDEGWYHSGDFGYLDNNCNVFITDRLKELIRVGGGYGVHVSATELEAVLFEHPAVSQVVVMGCHNFNTATDHPTAFVILKPEHQNQHEAALASIQKWAAERLQGLQRLSGGVIFVPKFPLVSFKIDRRTLKNLASNEEGMGMGMSGPRYIEVS